MTGLTLAVVLQTSLFAASADSYSAAHKETTKTGRPMIVLVGADWCPACVVMKDKVIPQVQRRGVLRKVAFAVVNLDRQSKLGRKLTGGGPIPQFIMFRKTSDGWRRRKLVGGQSVKTVCTFVEEGVRLDTATKKSRGKGSVRTEEKAKPKAAKASQGKAKPIKKPVSATKPKGTA